MAAILVYAGVKSYEKFQTKRANPSTGSQKKLRKDRKSISSLIIPSIVSAHIAPGGEDDQQPPRYEFIIERKASVETPYCTALHLPNSIVAPTRTAPPPPVMLGITLCESPVTPTTELSDESPSDFRVIHTDDIRGPSPVNASDDSFSEPMSPAPLRVMKRGSSPLPLLHEEPDMTYSEDETENGEGRHRTPRTLSYLEVPKSEVPRDFEPPPIPPKSPARRLRVVTS